MQNFENKFKLKTLKAPLFVNLDLTKHCNCNCLYCAIRDNLPIQSDYFPIRHFKKIIDKIVEAEVFEISFFGGEPFLYKGIYKLGAYAKKKGLSVGFVSNGTLIKKEDISRIKSSFDSGGLALNGVEEIHDKLCGMKGAFKKVEATIELFIKNEFPFGINTVICRSNLNYLDDFLTWLAISLPPNLINFNLFSSYDNVAAEELLSIEEMRNIFKIIEKHNQGDLKNKVSLNLSIPMCLFDHPYSIYHGGCSAGWTFAGIDVYGNVKICSSSSSIMGNILETPLTEIWMKSKDIIYFKSNSWADPRCKTCALFEKCHGGCMVTSSKSKYSLPAHYRQYIKNITKGLND